MIESRLMSIQEYATKHKLSTFVVIKQINSGKLKTIKEKVDGEEHEWIVDETVAVASVTVQTPKEEQPYERPSFVGSGVSHIGGDYKAQYDELLTEYQNLLGQYKGLFEYKVRYESLLKKFEEFKKTSNSDDFLSSPF